MPKGPQGQKRPGDVIGAAIMVAKIATGELPDSEELAAPNDQLNPKGRMGGLVGGPARADSLDPESRSAIAKNAAAKRWGK